MSDRCIAVDLGAESGRVIVGAFGDGRLTLSVVHRFATPLLNVGGTLRWDLPAIRREVAHGIRVAAQGGPVRSIGVDTWGVDYALLGDDGELLELPWSYRDARTAGVGDALHARFGEPALFARSGVRSLPFNTLFQLVAHRRADPATLARARRIVPISDALHHWLSGEAVCERTQAGTWQLATPGAEAWDTALMAELGLDPAVFAPITATGTVLGPVRPALAAELGLGVGCRVVLPGGHDTASAVAGMGADPAEACYLSSGTWSLIGAVAGAPVLSEAFRADGWSNEVAVDGRPRLNKNIMGLWLVQECRRAFVAAGRDASYAELARAAEAAPSAAAILDVDDPRFFAATAAAQPMPERIRAWYTERGLPAPVDDAALIRCCCEGLADAYRWAFAGLERHAGRRFAALTVVGGGVNNGFLNRLTARATGRPVLAGPGEATALGNVLVQARANRWLRDDAEARALLARSAEAQRFPPAAVAAS